LQGQSFGNLALFPNGALVETLMGFAYALVFLLTVVDRRAPKWSAAAVGLAAGAAVLLGGSVTLAGLNPARTLGTGVFAEAMGAGLIRHQLVYWLGSVIGAVLAGALYYHYLDESAAPQRPLQK
jgi:aquaporin Z